MTRTCIDDAELVDWLIRSYKEFKKTTLENSDIPLMEEELKDKKKALSNLLKQSKPAYIMILLPNA